jgi:hypothetical protein
MKEEKIHAQFEEPCGHPAEKKRKKVCLISAG